MTEKWINKGTLITSIQQDGDKRTFNIIKNLIIIGSLGTIFVTVAILFWLFEGNMPTEFILLSLSYIPMFLVAYEFFMAAALPNHQPVDVYSNGIEFHSNWLGTKLKLGGFVNKDAIDKINIILKPKWIESRGLTIIMKNGTIRPLHAKDVEMMKRIAMTLGSSLNLQIEER